MPEYLAPGVFVEEVSFRAKSIEGVATSTTGIAGRTRFGPVRYDGGPLETEPRLTTSFIEFERTYGSVDRLDGDDEGGTPYVAQAARAFFLNGGQRLYVSRVFAPIAGEIRPATPAGAPPDPGPGIATALVGGSGGSPVVARWNARWPGRMGAAIVEVRPMRSRNVALAATDPAAPPRVNGARDGALVEVLPAGTSVLPTAPLSSPTLRIVRVDLNGAQTFVGAAPGHDDQVFLVDLEVTVRVGPGRTDLTGGLGVDPGHRRYIGSVLGLQDPQDEDTAVWINPAVPLDPISLAIGLTGTATPAVGRFALTGGNDGRAPSPDQLRGDDTNPDDSSRKATGISALSDIDDIAIVMMPDAATLDTEDERKLATDYLIAHASRPGAYRIAIADPPRSSSLNQVREFRGQFDSHYAALYYPWVQTLDPTQTPEQGTAPSKILLPPSGFVAGIYARSDISRGVHKAPANEVVQGLTRFEANINTPRQQVLNPEGINALRFFPGRGSRVWGARTMSSDPEWKYVNVRRFFLFLEHSLDLASQWAVFEPNGDLLWAKVARAIAEFLDGQWREGALLGTTPAQAYFVRCDRTTMTQNDLDNGRLICLVGVAPVRPAEFVIFRIGQWTADARS